MEGKLLRVNRDNREWFRLNRPKRVLADGRTGDLISLEGWWGMGRFLITSFGVWDFPSTPARGCPTTELRSQTLYPEIAAGSTG